MTESKPRYKLVAAREEKGLTGEDVASMVNITRPFYVNIEKGRATPSLAVAYRIARLLNKSIEELFFNRNVRQMNNISA